jgi:hypothetical protein
MSHIIRLKTTAGAPTEVAPDGDMVLNTFEDTLYMRSGGAWIVIGGIALTAGSVLFAGAGGTIIAQDNPNFFYDDGANLLKIALISGITGNRTLYKNAMVRAVMSVAQTLTTATDTPLQFGGTDTFDTDSMHDPGSAPNNQRLIAPYPGKFKPFGGVLWQGNATGLRRLYIRKNGAGNWGVRDMLPPSASDFFMGAPGDVVDMTTNDYIELMGHEASGGSLDVKVDNGTYFGMIYVGQ